MQMVRLILANKKKSLRRSLLAIVPLLILSGRMYVLLYIYIYTSYLIKIFIFFWWNNNTLSHFAFKPCWISNAINNIRRFCPSPRIWPELPETSQICRGVDLIFPKECWFFSLENKWVMTELLNQKSNAVYRMFIESFNINHLIRDPWLFVFICLAIRLSTRIMLVSSGSIQGMFLHGS